MTDAKNEGFKQSALVDWQFNPDHVNKLTGLEEDSRARDKQFIEAGQRARRTFRLCAAPGKTVAIVARKPNPDPSDFMVTIDGVAIGMLQSVGLQVDVRNGVTLSLAWPREAGYFVQELWVVAGPESHLEHAGGKTFPGLRVTLIEDINASNPVDPEHL